MEKTQQPQALEKLMGAQRERLSDAEDATSKEHELTFVQAIKLYPKAVGWSVLMSCAIIMDGYDLKLIGSLFAQTDGFVKAYGRIQPDGNYQIPAPWQSGLNNGSNVGQMMGLFIGGSLSERFGFRKTMMTALMIVPCLIFIQFFAPSLAVLQVAQILMGIPLGMFQTVVCVYAVEVMPTCLRAYLTSFVNMCWLIGQLIASSVLRGTLRLQIPWAYRIPFAMQWFWPIPLLVGVYFAPESPWWLVRQNRLEQAKHSVRRLTMRGVDDFDVDKNVALMVFTTDRERELNAGIHYADCFKGIDLRRTIIVIGCYCIQVLGGSTLRSYATYFFQQAGLATDQAFNMSIVTYGISLGGVAVSWLLMPHVGRRTLFLWGLSLMTAIMMMVGGLGVARTTSTNSSSGLSWGIGALLLVSAFLSNVAIGPVSYALVSEIPSSILRSKSVVIARFSYAVLNIVANVITPYQLNPSAWGWGAISGFFWAGAALLGFVFTYFAIPEPAGRTVAELDLLFERKVSARKFAKTEVSICDAVVGGGSGPKME